MPNRTAILVANLGTPDAPTPRALRRYLAQFLSDPRIIDLPAAIWKPVLYGVVLRTRPPRSAKLYRSIWTADGSPLRVTSRQISVRLRQSIRDYVGIDVPTALGMRYGEPGIDAALRSLRDSGATQILVLPLFPQYSATTTASIFDAVTQTLSGWRNVPALRTIRHYYAHPLYIDALASRVRVHWAEHGPPDRLLLSFHGIPQRYAAQGDPYPEHCRATADLLARWLDLPPDRWQISYQSQFGPGQWLAPATSDTLTALGAGGTRRVDVLCPGFAVDSLETLQEIAIEGRHTFLSAGGETFHYIPALNATDEHITLLTLLAAQHTQGWL